MTSQPVRSKPDFLCIGAHKAGTTWLHARLAQHPQIWLPPKKELHYFDRAVSRYPSPSYLSCSRGLLGRAFGTSLPNRQYRKEIAKAGLDVLRSRSLTELRWYKRFFLGAHDDNWYQSLFPQDPGMVAGEITPAYSMLLEEDVEHVHALLPAAKVLFVLRDPVERTWSAIRYQEGRYKKLDGLTSRLTSEELLKLVASRAYSMKSDYVGTIRRWSKYYPKEQFRTCFFDDLRDRPGDFLSGVLGFLGVDAKRMADADQLGERINSSSSVPIPVEFRDVLYRHFEAMLEELRSEIGPLPSSWCAR